MSEIKGQLFGILLVVAVFGVVGATLVEAFSEAAGDVKEKITEEVNLTPSKDDTNSIESHDFIYSGEILKF